MACSMISPAAVIMAALIAASPAATASDPCATQGRLVGLANGHGLLVLCAACDVVAGADSVCSAILGPGWKTDDPATLTTQTSRASVASGLDWLCAKIGSLPRARQDDVIGMMDSWLDATEAVEAMGLVVGGEAFATAVVFVPAVADLFPRDETIRAALGREIGETLASGEMNGLEYDVAGRLARMSRADRKRCLRSLWIEALQAGE